MLRPVFNEHGHRLSYKSHWVLASVCMREDGHAALRMEFDKFQRIKYTHEKLESTVQKIMKKKKNKRWNDH